MRKLTKGQITKYLSFLDDNKRLVGLQGWSRILKDKIGDDEDYAEVNSNIFEQTLTVNLNHTFFDLNDDRQESVLLHELVHGRIDIYKKIVEEITEFEEERLANDLERGFYALHKEINKE